MIATRSPDMGDNERIRPVRDIGTTALGYATHHPRRKVGFAYMGHTRCDYSECLA